MNWQVYFLFKKAGIRIRVINCIPGTVYNYCRIIDSLSVMVRIGLRSLTIKKTKFSLKKAKFDIRMHDEVFFSTSEL